MVPGTHAKSSRLLGGIVFGCGYISGVCAFLLLSTDFLLSLPFWAFVIVMATVLFLPVGIAMTFWNRPKQKRLRGRADPPFPVWGRH